VKAMIPEAKARHSLEIKEIWENYVSDATLRGIHRPIEFKDFNNFIHFTLKE
jgi:hypothetical protein